MSFYPRRNVDNRGGWFPSIFGMNPFSMMSLRMSDIFDPINHDIDQLLDRSLHWIDLPTTSRQKQQQTRQRQMSRQQPLQQQQRQQSLPKQKQHQQMHTQMHTSQQQKQVQCKMPQKFRILIDCSDCNPKTLKTQIKTVNDQKHLIVCADEQKINKNVKCDTSCTTKFKRTYTLPKQCDINKMISFVTPNGHFVCEFPLQEVVCCQDIDMVPKIEKTPEGRIVSLRVPIPQSVDPSKVKLTVKGCECILRFEDRFGTEDCVSRVYFYNRCTLPDGADLNKIKCSADKHRLIITAPLLTDSKTWQSRDIPIQRKIRHKTLLSTGDEKQKNISRSKSPISSEQRKSSIKSDQQKQKSPTKITDQQKQKSPTKDKDTQSSTDKKKKNKSTTGEEKTGSDILKSVFGSGQSDKDKDKNKSENKSEKKIKSSGDIKSEFPLLPSDNKQVEGHHQQQ